MSSCGLWDHIRLPHGIVRRVLKLGKDGTAVTVAPMSPTRGLLDVIGDNAAKTVHAAERPIQRTLAPDVKAACNYGISRQPHATCVLGRLHTTAYDVETFASGT